MEKFKVKITQTFVYEIDVNAENKSKALKYAKEYYEKVDDGYVGVASGETFDNVRFKVIEKE